MFHVLYGKNKIVTRLVLISLSSIFVCNNILGQSAKSDSLFAIGVDLYNAGKYKEAIPTFSECDKLDKVELDSTNNRREYSAMWLASCYYHVGDTIKASSTNKYYKFPPVDRRKTIDSDRLSDQGFSFFVSKEYEKALNSYQECARIELDSIGEHYSYANTLYGCMCIMWRLGRYEDAIQLGKEVLLIREKTIGKDHEDYIALLNELANCQSYIGKYAEAIKLGEEALRIYGETKGREHVIYATILNNIATYHAYLGNYAEAIKSGEEALKIREKTLGKEHLDVASSLSNLANCYSGLGNYTEAIKLGEEALRIREKTLSKDHLDFAKSLENLASYHSSLGNYTKAITLGEEVLKIREKTLGKEHPMYANSLSNLASCYYCLGNYTKAIKIGEEALTIREKTLGKEHPMYANSLNNLANCYYCLGNYTEAITIGEEASRIREKTLGKEHPMYANSLSNLASCYYCLGNYAESVKLGKEALKIREKTLGKEHPDVAISLSNLANYYSSLGNHAESVRLGKEALKIHEKALGKEHPDVASSLTTLANCYSSLGNYTEAIKLGEEALRIREKTFGKEHLDVANSLDCLASYHNLLGNYLEAIKLSEETLRIIEKKLGREHPKYANSLGCLANYESSMGYYTQAIRLGEEVLRIYENKFGKEHPNVATSLGSLANYYYFIGDYTEAIRLGKEALKIHEKAMGKEHPDFATSLSSLASYYYSAGNLAESIRLGKEALKIREETFGKEHPDVARSLSNLANCYSGLGNNIEAIKLGEKALRIREKTIGMEHPDIANSLDCLASYYYFLGDYPEANILEKEALKIFEKTLGKEHPHLEVTYRNICGISFHLRQMNELESYASIASKISTSNILCSFLDLNSYSRQKLWEKDSWWFQRNLYKYAYRFPTDSLTILSYDGTLLSKGLLLNSEMEIKKIIAESRDTELEKLYNQMYINKMALLKLYEKPIQERVLNTDSLVHEIDGQERQLVEKCKAYGDYTKNLHIEWQDVQAKLGTEDVSVEFVSFPIAEDSVMYIAYVLTKDMDCPKLVPLFEEKQLKKDHRLYTTSSLSKLVWEPLAEYLKGVKNVYFAPSGELYNICIESLPHWSENCLMSDKWNMYRLSSTRQLVVVKDKNSLKCASVYGGVKYDTKEDLLLADSKRYQSGERSFNYELFEIADSLNLRSGAAYLPATKIEAEEIDRTLEQKNIATTLKLDTLATEGAFKDLSGKKTNLLHIATHGFYWTEKEAQYSKNLDFLMLGENQPKYVEDKALTRSGLLLAGANNALMGKKLPEGVDDGILTAKEISQLDLRGLDLVVLSACQTGLGEIKGDGVFGLQRGFKKAGANSLLMSLWKVDDEATRLLMTLFYKNLTSGMSKYESLKQAQKYVREYEAEVEIKSDEKKHLNANQNEQARKDAAKEKEFKKVKKYQDPYYWAAFILLDAID